MRLTDDAPGEPSFHVDRVWGDRVEKLMVTLGSLDRHQRHESPTVHEPLALLWAIGQLAAGRGRLFRWPDFRDGVGAVLAEFGASRNTPQYPFWHLGADADLWERHGVVDVPTSADVDAVAGFTEGAARLLADPAVRAQAVDVVRGSYLADVVDQPALLRRVGLPVPVAPEAGDVLQRLVGRELVTVDGSVNRVLEVDARNVLVATGRSPQGKLVPVAWVQEGLDKLFARGRVLASVEELRYRSAFVAAVLATLPRAVVTKKPAAVSLGYAPVAPDPQFGVLDRTAVAKYRVEQGALRHVLIGDAAVGTCALCGRELPVDLLVAAHIKKRAECSDEERNDLRNVAMLACSLGCDRLFELGYVTVGADGTVVASPVEGALAEQLAQLAGRVAGAHHPGSAGYFAWHREHVFERGVRLTVGGGR
ncbi:MULTISPECIES: HNH endonuclease [unclassified Saccharothrix]|uniref:HNH endonuclease n=1 Tax=unclassified Saccharothrix TaxID=2593673 RepID=UPI00307EA952